LVDKMRVFYNHPDFIEANADRVRAAREAIPVGLRDATHLVFTAHSIPESMARNCRYAEQLGETARLVADATGFPEGRWSLAYQSRSGRPQDPWLEPDILDYLDELSARGVSSVIIHPVGFLSDHMEVLFDLDEEARQKSEALGMAMVRSQTVGIHPRFVALLRELIAERVRPAANGASGSEAPASSGRRAIGQFGPSHDVCPADCCLPPARPRPQPTSEGNTTGSKPT
jgi:ferrochelatase